MHFKILTIIIFYNFIIISCAAIKAPPGGPKDQTPPELIETIPASGAVNFNGGKVELIFSEYLDKNSIYKAISVLPKFQNDPEIIFKGEKILIDFPRELLKNETYVISVNRKLRDEHGVSLAEGTQVAFSTGSKINKGSISGKVYGDQPRSVLLWKIDNSKDSIRYYLEPEDYIIDVSDEGTYNLNYLSAGVYRIAAINEKSIGLPLDSKHALVGLPWENYLEISNDVISINNVDMIIPSKSSQNKMLRAEWLYPLWIKVFFKNNLDDIISKSPIKLFNDDIEIKPVNFFQDRLDRSLLHITLEDTTEDLESIIIKTERVVQSGIILLDSGQVLVSLNIQQDSTKLKINYPEKGYTQAIQNDTILPMYIDFSSLINQKESTALVELLKDSLLVPINLRWDSPLTLVLTPKENWSQNQKYLLIIHSNSLNPVYGNSFADSTSSINFSTSKPIRFGRIVGQLKSDFLENIMINIKGMGKNKSTEYFDKLETDKTFFFDHILEGDYKLTIFYDSDKNYRYSYGDISIDKSAEFFFNYGDTIKVRGNWDLELPDLEFFKKY